MAEDLKPLLDGYTGAALTQMASFHGLAKAGPRPKAETIRMLAPALLDPKRIQAALRDLAPAERAALETLQRSGGKLSLHSLRESLKRQGLIQVKPPVT